MAMSTTNTMEIKAKEAGMTALKGDECIVKRVQSLSGRPLIISHHEAQNLYRGKLNDVSLWVIQASRRKIKAIIFIWLLILLISSKLRT